MFSVAKICGILSATVFLVSAHNETACLKYLDSCTEGSRNCCNYPAVSCLPDKKNSTSCLSLYDVVNLNPLLTGMAAIQPLLQNATGFLTEVIQVNGKSVYNTTEAITPKPNATKNPKPVTTTKPNSSTKSLGLHTQKQQEHESNPHESH